MKQILVLGSGCAKCNNLYQNVDDTARQLDIEYSIEKVTDILRFVDYGVMITPALVIDGKLKLAGKLPSQEQLKQFLQED